MSSTHMMNGYGMMGGSGGGTLMFLSWVVWLAVGILAAIWLWKQIQK